MWIIADCRLPEEVKDNLKKIGSLVLMPISKNVFAPISAHPDIFMCQNRDEIWIAPNTPQQIINFFNDNRISYQFGSRIIGNNHPETTGYNIIVTDNTIISHPIHVDSSVFKDQINKEFISVKQAYVRCSTIHLGDEKYITSDKHIYQILKQHHREILYIDPKGILLPGLNYGLFGGCVGVFNNILYICGSLNSREDGELIQAFLRKANIRYVELYHGPLFDAGGLFFISHS